MNSLLKNYRGRFPFKLATTSYIYPDEIVPNVARLALSFDEIELVLFESKDENSIPDRVQIEQLIRLTRLHRVGFNIHLPLDIFLGDECEQVRARGVAIAKKVIERTLPLQPSLYTLHLDLKNPPMGTDFKSVPILQSVPISDPIESWRLRLMRSLEEILADGIEPKKVSIETLGYPFEWIEDIVRRFGFSICLDIGHILTHGYDLERYLKSYLPETSIIHLHGVRNEKDHLGIEKLAGPVLEKILSCLRQYRGIVSIEVFSIDELRSSLDILEGQWAEG